MARSRRPRRTRYCFTATPPEGGEPCPVDVLAHSPAAAAQIAARLGWTDLRPRDRDSASRKLRVDADGLRALKAAMGVTWPVVVKRSRARTRHGQCVTRPGVPSHEVFVSVFAPEPEQVIRHELAHAAYNERNIEAHGAHTFRDMLIADRRAHGYHDSETERNARSFEDFRLDIPVCQISDSGA